MVDVHLQHLSVCLQHLSLPPLPLDVSDSEESCNAGGVVCPCDACTEIRCVRRGRFYVSYLLLMLFNLLPSSVLLSFSSVMSFSSKL